jgi:putative ABC transport system substrate-binding protein
MRSIQLGRREFITLIGGAAATWLLAARAQQGNRVPRVGVLRVGTGDSPLVSTALAAFQKAIQELGWIDGSNIRIDYRMASSNDVAQIPVMARELLSLKPDVILAHTLLVVAAFQRETKNIPIVFVAINDPVASGFVQSLSHPGGNITGFSNFEPTLAGKYIEILKEIMPGMTAVSAMFYADNPDRFKITHPFLEATARYHAVELKTAPVRNDSDIDRAISGLGDNPTKDIRHNK